MFLFKFLPVLLLGLVSNSDGARILSLIPFTGKSHYINIQPILQRLAERGHELTVVTTHYEKNPLPNYHQIILDNRTFWDSFGKDHDKFSFANMPYAKEMKLLWDGTYFSTEVAFNSSSLQKFIKEDNSHYDLIFIELFFQEAFYMFAHKYKAPMVAISTMGFTQYSGDFMGNPLHMSFMPHEFLSTKGKLDLWTRMMNIYYTAYDIIGRHLYVLPRHERLVERHFQNLPKPWPRIHDIERNVSVVLINSHYSIDIVRPLVPGIVEIGGVHIKQPKSLSQNIKKFLDEAEHGAIFFSLGSNLNSKDMPKHKIDMFLKVFSKLKQRVLWKWEDEHLAGISDNVMTGPWFPQTDILAHPKIHLFITHGGLLSMLEAVHFGVPVIGISVYGDQHLNAAKTENLGFGIKLAFSEINEQILTAALEKILGDPSYFATAKELSVRFRDRPLSPMDSAIYWIEYVIKHKGARFMRSSALDIGWYEFRMLDILFLALTVLLAVCAMILYAIRKIIKIIKCVVCSRKGTKKIKTKKS